MITWRSGAVVQRRNAWGGALELQVELDRPLPDSDVEVRALAYTGLVGEPSVGDTVLLNCTALVADSAVDYALVVGPAGLLPPDPPQRPGHLVKVRSTPLQAQVLGVDEPASEHREAMVAVTDLRGLPVVVADLHAALPAVIAGARHAAGLLGSTAPRIAYLMTDCAALPIAASRTVATLQDAGWLSATITVGQAFGGDLEALTLYSALLAAAEVVDADLAVVIQGPGNVDTGTCWGFSGVGAGEAINAASVLQGRPVAALRVSGSAGPGRTLGVSRHSLTAYGQVALRPADVAVPAPTLAVEALPGWGAALTARVLQQVEPLGSLHNLVEVSADIDLVATLGTYPGELVTLGRALDNDPAAFVAAAVAGVHAAQLVT